MNSRNTRISIEGNKFKINGDFTYKGRAWRGMPIEGLLLNSRMVQGIFDDKNPETVGRWSYPDTGKWDAERNTREFIEAMPLWRENGLLAFTINLQGGSPEGYSNEQPWRNSAILEDGSLDSEYLRRLERILDKADELGMAVILGYFYFGQDRWLQGEQAVIRAAENVTRWIFDKGYTHILAEINNECDVRYTHPILQPQGVHRLVRLVQSMGDGKQKLLVSASFGGGSIPTDNVVASSDFILVHGNGVEDPGRIGEMVDAIRDKGVYRGQPILFNEDDHFDFDKDTNNMVTAMTHGASWGYFDPGLNNYRDGYQSPPVNWGINTRRKNDFFNLVKEAAERK